MKDLNTSLGEEIEDLNSDTALRYLVGTSTNLNNYTQDIGGGDGGGLSNPITTDGTQLPIPEPSTSIMLLLGILTACGIRRR